MAANDHLASPICYEHPDPTQDWLNEAAQRHDESVQRRIDKAKLGDPCLSRCKGVPCEFGHGHPGLHVTSKEGMWGWWATHHQDPPDRFTKVLGGVFSENEPGNEPSKLLQRT